MKLESTIRLIELLMHDTSLCLEEEQWRILHECRQKLNGHYIKGLPDPSTEELEMAENGSRIPAIKKYIERTGVSIRAGKSLFDLKVPIIYPGDN